MKKITLIVCVMAAASAFCFGAKKKSLQKSLPASQGVNELAGKTIVYADYDGSVANYEFSGKNLTVTTSFEDIGFSVQNVMEYSWDSRAKTFWTRCISKNGKSGFQEILDDRINSIFCGMTRAEFIEDAVLQVEEIEGSLSAKARKNLIKRIEAEIDEEIRLESDNVRREMEKVTKWHYILAGDGGIRFIESDFDPKADDWYDWKFTSGNEDCLISLQRISRCISENESVQYRLVSVNAGTMEYKKVSTFYGLESDSSVPEKIIFSYEIGQLENGRYFLTLENGKESYKFEFYSTHIADSRFKQ